MDPANHALWFIESHLSEDLTLDGIATIAGVSHFHLSHAFALTMGHSVMGYLRGRRLTEAAHKLANGAPDILTVALDSGYASHEAFTRAFRDQFGLTPQALRTQRHVSNLALLEPIKMDEKLLLNLDPPRIENGRALLIGGLSKRYDETASAEIPAQWQAFGPHIGHIPGQIGFVAYGVIYNSDGAGNADYMCGVELSNFTALPPDFARLQIPKREYAVFAHHGHISDIRRTWYTIYNKWLPESGRKIADAPSFERYGEDFDGRAGTGTVEIWIPLQA